MKRALTALFLIPVTFAVVLIAPKWLFLAVLGLVAVLAAREYLQLAKAHTGAAFTRTVLILTGAPFAAVAIACARSCESDSESALLYPIVMAILFCLPFILLVAGMRRPDPKQGLLAAAVSYFAFLYVVLPLASLAIIRDLSPFFVVLLFLVVWSGDVAAFYFGSAFGKHKLAPQISPGKSVEGAVASLVAAVLVCWALGEFVGPRFAWRNEHDLHVVAPPLWLSVVAGVVINLTAQLGDLVESMIKRGAGVKDSGSLLPGHGGVLDRIDALLFAAPSAVLVFIASREFFLRHA